VLVGLANRLKPLTRSLIFAASIAALSVILIRVLVFPLGTLNADELVYQNMTAAFLKGQTKIGVDPVFGFQSASPWLMSNVGAWSVPKYQPLFSLFLVPAHWLGLWLPLSILAFASTYSIGKLAEAFSASSIRAAWLWNGSTAFIISAATALPYILSLELGVLMLLVAIKSNKHTFIKLGTLVGLAVLCRPMDGVLFAAVSLVLLWQRKELKGFSHFVRFGLAMGLACIPALIWNWVQTGNPLQFPFTLTSSLDSWGFGMRKVYDSDPGTNFTFWNGMDATVNNLGRVLTWTFGGIILLPMAFVAIRHGFIKYRLSILVWGITWIVAYGSFWGSYTTIRFWNGPDYLGPFYWLPISLILILLISAAPKAQFNSKFLWTAAGLLGIFVFGSVISKNWIMTESWKTSALMKISKNPESVIKIDKSYSTHIGAPIQLISNPEGARRFSVDWQGVLAIIKDSKLKSPNIWVAMAGDKTRFDYLPLLSKVSVDSTAQVYESKNTQGLILQIASDSKCVFKSIAPKTQVELSLSEAALEDDFPGTCSERAESHELVFKLLSAENGNMVHRMFSFYDPESKKYFSTVF
jgi:hypothetical protein